MPVITPNVTTRKVPSSAHPTTPTHPMLTWLKDGIHKPRILCSTSHPLPTALTASTYPVEPTCYTMAAKSSAWHEAMALEFDALQRKKDMVLCSCQTQLEYCGMQMGLQIEI